MIGIYQDSILDYLSSHFPGKVKTRSKNIVIPCPWCEYGKEKKHYHMYISLEAPIFHCFLPDCKVSSGVLPRLIKKLEGKDISERFVDKEKISSVPKRIFEASNTNSQHVLIPDLKKDVFPYKEMCLQKRLKFSNMSSEKVKGLVYDILAFTNLNNISGDLQFERLKQYLHTNFIGFLTEHQSCLICRNVLDNQSFRYYKIKIFDMPFVDYYKIVGNRTSSLVVVAEGIFDIFGEYLYNYLGIKDKVRFYASALSINYKSLLQSIVFFENIYQMDVVILSDSDVSLNYYKKLKRDCSYLIKSLNVVYNKDGKDFASSSVSPVKFVL